MTKVTFSIEVEPDVGPRDYLFLVMAAEDYYERHPLEIGEDFRASLQTAAAALADDPKVHEVPVYRPGSLEPVGYVQRSAP